MLTSARARVGARRGETRADIRSADLGAQATRPNGCRRAAGADLEQAVANRRVGPAKPYRSWLGCREPCDRSRPAGSKS
jgi:hypothetical protein